MARVWTRRGLGAWPAFLSADTKGPLIRKERDDVYVTQKHTHLHRFPDTFRALALGKQWSKTVALVLMGPLGW